MPEIVSSDKKQKLTSHSFIKRKKIMELIQGLPKKELGESISFFKGLPSMIRQNGIGQTLAFIESKEKHENILKIFEELFEPDLIKVIQKYNNADEYIKLQNDAIQYSGWIKEFALAFNIKPDEEDESEPTAS